MSVSHEQQSLDINPAQEKAVFHDGGHLLIVAGPGTGKTHTLTRRIAHLSKQLQQSQKILAVTFTNKAAIEMDDRLRQLGCRPEDIFVGTFHSFCLKVLRQFYRQAKLSENFQVIPIDEIDTLAKQIWPAFSKKERSETIKDISQWKAAGFADEGMPDDVSVYNKKLRDRCLLDFDDLLLETITLLQTDDEVCRQLRQLYRAIFVDEYQDINPAQHILLKLLIADDVRLTAIGDPNQAIYGFRGSDVRFFKSFSDDFPGSTHVTLEENYRSAQNLLTASSQVMSKEKFQAVPELIAKIYREGKLTIHDATTDKAEAEYVVHQIETMVGGTSMFSQDSGRVDSSQEGSRGFGDVAVLYRLNSQKNLLKVALERSGIPYEIAGSKFLESELLPKPDDKYIHRTDKVSLMTMHAAKGLEFPVVFIMGCEDNLLPLKLENLEGQLEEERRLFYVGMTRAKEQLFLIRARRRYLLGQALQNNPSPFLKDIEESLKVYEKTSPPKSSKLKKKQQLSLFKF